MRTETVLYRPKREGTEVIDSNRDFSLPAPGILVQGARRARNIRLEDLARKTRISKRNLEALEEDRFEDLPADSFVRGYLKLLAEELEEDPALWVAAYEDFVGSSGRILKVEEPDWVERRDWFNLPAMNVRFRIGHVFAVVLAIVAFFLIYFALEGGSTKQTTTAERPEGSLIKMLDMRPVQRN